MTRSEPEEPLWLDSDTDAVLAYFREEALKCSGCGLPRDETMRHESEVGQRYFSRAIKCHACGAQARRAKKDEARPHEGGLFYTIEDRGLSG